MFFINHSNKIISCHCHSTAIKIVWIFVNSLSAIVSLARHSALMSFRRRERDRMSKRVSGRESNKHLMPENNCSFWLLGARFQFFLLFHFHFRSFALSWLLVSLLANLYCVFFFLLSCSLCFLIRVWKCEFSYLFLQHFSISCRARCIRLMFLLLLLLFWPILLCTLCGDWDWV